MASARASTAVRRWAQRWAAARGRRRVLLWAAVELAYAWWLVRCRPFRRVAAALGTAAAPLEPPPQVALSAVDARRARDIGWAVHALARRLPQLTCLMQVLAARRMLRRRGIAATTFLGILADRPAAASDPLLAHAWLYCGTRVIVGDGDLSQYRVIASFS